MSTYCRTPRRAPAAIDETGRSLASAHSTTGMIGIAQALLDLFLGHTGFAGVFHHERAQAQARLLVRQQEMMVAQPLGERRKRNGRGFSVNHALSHTARKKGR